jgi:hypothetical protein
MKAIVLTCDKYIKFADHMIYTYQKLWPSHPFTFRVPYGEYPNNFEKYGDQVELIQMDSAKVIHPVETDKGTKQVSLIRNTVLNLLKDLPDEEWIYWCMDDRYLIRIQEKAINDIYDFVTNNAESNLLAIVFLRNRKGGYFKSDKHIQEGVSIPTPTKQVFLRETVYSQGDFLPDLWSHQFMRVKALRRIFESFPDRPFLGKEMDSFKHIKLVGERQLIVDNNIAVYGESTSRGEITENCAASFKRWRMELPNNMNISKSYFVVGELPYQWLGLKFTPAPRVKQFLTDVTRWYWRNI